MRWARHLLSAAGLRKRAEHLWNFLETAAEERAVEAPKGGLAQLHGMRTESGPFALQAFWRMHVEAMNFIGMGLAEHAVALVSHLIRCAFDAIAWNNTATK